MTHDLILINPCPTGTWFEPCVCGAGARSSGSGLTGCFRRYYYHTLTQSDLILVLVLTHAKPEALIAHEHESERPPWRVSPDDRVCVCVFLTQILNSYI